MSNLEQLIENAIVCIEKNKEFEDFVELESKLGNAKDTYTTLEEIWEIAMYIKIKRCQFCENKIKSINFFNNESKKISNGVIEILKKENEKMRTIVSADKYKTVSQCITSDYCRGWNDAIENIVNEFNDIPAITPINIQDFKKVLKKAKYESE